MQPNREGVGIYLTGKFNPAVVQPMWLASQGLITDSDAKQANEKISIHAEITQFSTDWFTLRIRKKDFILSTEDPTAYLPLRDLAYSIFTLLDYTPVDSLIFAREMLFGFANTEKRNEYFDTIVPTSQWREGLEKVRFRQLNLDADRKDDLDGKISVIIQPSNKIENSIYFDVLSTINVPNENTTDFVTEKIMTHFDVALKEALEIAHFLLKKAEIS